MSDKKSKRCEYLKELERYSTILSLMVLHHYELLLLEIQACNFNLSSDLKQKVIDAVDGEYIEKTKRRYEYYEELVKNG